MVEPVHCRQCAYRGPVLYAHDPPPLWLPLLALTGVGLLAVLLRSSASRRACPRCGRHDHLEPMQGDRDPDCAAVWQAAVAANELVVRRTWRRTWLTLAVAVPLAIAGLVLVLRRT